MVKQSDWASYGMMEQPFWRNDMTPEEYEIERAYLVNIFNRGRKAIVEYKPLWRQGKKVDFDLSRDFMEIIELADKMRAENGEKTYTELEDAYLIMECQLEEKEEYIDALKEVNDDLRRR